MKLALHAPNDLGRRVAHVILSFAEVERLGITNRKPTDAYGKRAVKISSLSGFDALVVAGTDGSDKWIGEAWRRGLPIITPTVPDGRPATANGRPAAADLRSTLAPALAREATSRFRGSLESVAWTEPSAPLKRGTAVHVPPPVGSVWGEEAGTIEGASAYRAPTNGQFGGVIATVRDGDTTKTLATADDRLFLESIVLAAAAIATLSDGHYYDVVWALCLDAGLETATLTTGS